MVVRPREPAREVAKVRGAERDGRRSGSRRRRGARPSSPTFSPRPSPPPHGHSCQHRGCVVTAAAAVARRRGVATWPRGRRRVLGIWWKWLQRRSQRAGMTWDIAPVPRIGTFILGGPPLGLFRLFRVLSGSPSDEDAHRRGSRRRCSSKPPPEASAAHRPRNSHPEGTVAPSEASLQNNIAAVVAAGGIPSSIIRPGRGFP